MLSRTLAKRAPSILSSSTFQASRNMPLRRPSMPASSRNLEYLIHEKNDEPVLTNLTGRALLNNSVLNKGAAFTREERETFKLESYLPYEFHDLDIQIERAWEQLNARPNNVLKYSFLSSMRDQNQVLYYSLVLRHIKELLPIIYTPTVGDAIQQYSHLFRRPVGAYLSFPNKETMERDLLLHKPNNECDLIVCTDSEGILGIGDQGVGGIYICIGKSAVYTVGGGIDPKRILPLVLDVGTDNSELLNDPLYLGWRHSRIRGEEYDSFINQFTEIVKRVYPDALLHFEDFGLKNAQRILDSTRPHQSVFNDDIQGTAAVVLAAVTGALGVTKGHLKDQRIVVYGFGSAGYGIANFLRQSMILDEGLSSEKASAQFYPVDRFGLVTTDQELRPGQETFAKTPESVANWVKTSDGEGWGLLDVIKNAKPTILIGTSTHAGAFNEQVVKEMSKHCERPIIFPLSNPTSKCEADPADIDKWSGGKALIATGSPFPAIKTPDGKVRKVAECNNALVYPGLALGTIVSKASALTDKMITSGVKALAKLSPAIQDPNESLLPDLSDVRRVSVVIGTAVANAAVTEGKETGDAKERREEEGAQHGDNGHVKWTEEAVRKYQWDPVYRPLELTENPGPHDDQSLTGTW